MKKIISFLPIAAFGLAPCAIAKALEIALEIDSETAGNIALVAFCILICLVILRRRCDYFSFFPWLLQTALSEKSGNLNRFKVDKVVKHYEIGSYTFIRVLLSRGYGEQSFMFTRRMDSSKCVRIIESIPPVHKRSGFDSWDDFPDVYYRPLVRVIKIPHLEVST